MLVVTGGEALYADLVILATNRSESAGSLVYPALVAQLSRAGRLLLEGAPFSGGNLFYSFAPRRSFSRSSCWRPCDGDCLAGAHFRCMFATLQAMRLGLFPRLNVVHTHHAHAGTNLHSNRQLGAVCRAVSGWFCLSLPLPLWLPPMALSVSGAMLITSLAMIAIARLYWSYGARALSLSGSP